MNPYKEYIGSIQGVLIWKTKKTRLSGMAFERRRFEGTSFVVSESYLIQLSASPSKTH